MSRFIDKEYEKNLNHVSFAVSNNSQHHIEMAHYLSYLPVPGPLYDVNSQPMKYANVLIFLSLLQSQDYIS